MAKKTNKKKATKKKATKKKATKNRPPLQIPMRAPTIVSAAMRAEEEVQAANIKTLDSQHDELIKQREDLIIQFAEKSAKAKRFLPLSGNWSKETCFECYRWNHGDKLYWVDYNNGDHDSFRVKLAGKSDLARLRKMTNQIQKLDKELETSRSAYRDLVESKSKSRDWVQAVFRAKPKAAEQISKILRDALAEFSV